MIVAAYRAEATIARAIRSALAQPELGAVVVVDDASDDGTTRAAEAADDGSGRLIVLRQPRNTGPAAARNLALDHCRSDWVTVLDADDLMLPGRLHRLRAAADGADMIADDLLAVDEGAQDRPPRPMLEPAIVAPVDVGFAAFVDANLTHHGGRRRDLGYIKPLMRRGFLDAHAIRYDPALRLGEDYELYARALLHGARLRIVPACGYVYVMRPRSLSGSHGIDDLARFRDCDLALMRVPGVTRDQVGWLRRHYRSVDCRLQWRCLIEAVKARRPAGVAAAFARSPQVAFYLSFMLAKEAVARRRRRRPVASAR